MQRRWGTNSGVAIRFGIENLVDLIKIHKEDHSLLKRWDQGK
jgi:hypothetical protein